MSNPPAPTLYPSASEAALKELYLDKSLHSFQAPAAILDVAIIRRNCKYMLDTARALGLGFRAHVKTHKTTQLTRLQMGEESRDVRLVVSTVAEAENLVEYLLECKGEGRSVNVLYGMPVAPSHVPRLAAVAKTVGGGSIGLFVDHPGQLEFLTKVEESVWPGEISVWVKIDAGYHRAGLSPESKMLDDISRVVAGQSKVRIRGAYAHMGHSYSAGSPEEALEFLRLEIEGVMAGAEHLAKSLPVGDKLTLSVGATPTATSTQNLTSNESTFGQYRSFIDKVKQSFDVELHAGVYPVLDMQQLATRARPSTIGSKPRLNFDSIAIRIMVEVASVYNERERPEALIGAGSIVLGREPCKSYSGWGVVTPWQSSGGKSNKAVYDPDGSKTGWIVGRISQEHGILTWEGDQSNARRLDIGEKVMIWPNHACMAGPNFGWYLIVDSDTSDPDKVVDVWSRWRGW